MNEYESQIYSLSRATYRTPWRDFSLFMYFHCLDQRRQSLDFISFSPPTTCSSSVLLSFMRLTHILQARRNVLKNRLVDDDGLIRLLAVNCRAVRFPCSICSIYKIYPTYTYESIRNISILKQIGRARQDAAVQPRVESPQRHSP